MPGFNHYIDCACGWCVNHGRMSRSDRTRLISDLYRRDAMKLLEQESARSISGCYVNPNAHCPVCKAAVYFYANEHGSRVFFDELGPPWPKHPCTDIPRDFTPKGRAPARRTRGTMQELISAANVAGLFSNKVFGRRVPGEWALLIVLEVRRTGQENFVIAEFLDSFKGETSSFTCQSALPVLQPSDFINMKDGQVSFVHNETLRPVTFKIGEAVVIPQTAEEDPNPPSLPAKRPQPGRGRLIHAAKDGRDYSREPMTESEMVHFNSNTVSLGDIFTKLESVVKAYAREHIRKPPDVSARLNVEGYRTANGALWTPRLVSFLLASIFNDFAGSNRSGAKNSKLLKAKLKPSAPKLPIISMDDRDEIAKRLSALGRVKRKSP